MTLTQDTDLNRLRQALTTTYNVGLQDVNGVPWLCTSYGAVRCTRAIRKLFSEDGLDLAPGYYAMNRRRRLGRCNTTEIPSVEEYICSLDRPRPLAPCLAYRSPITVTLPAGLLADLFCDGDGAVLALNRKARLALDSLCGLRSPRWGVTTVADGHRKVAVLVDNDLSPVGFMVSVHHDDLPSSWLSDELPTDWTAA